MCKISVIVPVYKVEKYLSRCVDSILRQTYTNLEIILVDDGSPDRCGAICDEYAGKDSRITVLHKPNGGLSDARNAGIRVATGEYIAFVDSDDYIAPTMYGRLYTALMQAKADIAICNFLYVDENGVEIGDNDALPIGNEILLGKQILTERLLSNKQWYWIVAWNKLYKKEIFCGIEYPKGKIHEDEFVIHHLLHRATVACIPDKLIYYVQRMGSIMSDSAPNKRFDEMEALLDRGLFMQKNGYRAEDLYHFGIAIRGKLYTLCTDAKKDMQYKGRYRALHAKYKTLLWKIDRHGLRSKEQVKLFLSALCPVLAWKIETRSGAVYDGK